MDYLEYIDSIIQSIKHDSCLLNDLCRNIGFNGYASNIPIEGKWYNQLKTSKEEGVALYAIWAPK